MNPSRTLYWRRAAGKGTSEERIARLAPMCELILIRHGARPVTPPLICEVCGVFYRIGIDRRASRLAHRICGNYRCRYRLHLGHRRRRLQQRRTAC